MEWGAAAHSGGIKRRGGEAEPSMRAELAEVVSPTFTTQMHDYKLELLRDSKGAVQGSARGLLCSDLEDVF